MTSSLRDILAARQVVLLDGGMGTELQRAGLGFGACGEAWNLDRPAAVAAIHAAYRSAGARCLTTNSFSATRLRLAEYGEEARVAAINEAAVRLARAAAGDGAWVLGDIGPLGRSLTPDGELEPALAEAAFAEQARALVASGVDAVLIETMQSVDEACLAVRAARAAGADLVLASFSFDRSRRGLRTITGATPAQAAEAMAGEGVAAVGANCGSDLSFDDWADLVRAMAAATSLPILARPNAGEPELGAHGFDYPWVPAVFATLLETLLAAGATLIGGCCGTRPAHIVAAASLV